MCDQHSQDKEGEKKRKMVIEILRYLEMNNCIYDCIQLEFKYAYTFCLENKRLLNCLCLFFYMQSHITSVWNSGNEVFKQELEVDISAFFRAKVLLMLPCFLLFPVFFFASWSLVLGLL